MNESTISVRYAKALFALAEEKNLLELLYEDMKVLLQTLNQSKDLHWLIENPVLSVDQKYSIFLTVFKNLNDTTKSFLKMVFSNKRAEYLTGMCRHYLDLHRSKKGIKSGTITTASELNDALRLKIKQLVKEKFNTEVELEENIDERIIGGYILRIDDRQLNASLQAKLNELKREIIK
jgi:F-type H+-transporting ATPase subunit delta